MLHHQVPREHVLLLLLLPLLRTRPQADVGAADGDDDVSFGPGITLAVGESHLVVAREGTHQV